MNIIIKGILVNDNREFRRVPFNLRDISYIVIEKKDHVFCINKKEVYEFLEVSEEVIKEFESLIECNIGTWAILKQQTTDGRTYYLNLDKIIKPYPTSLLSSFLRFPYSQDLPLHFKDKVIHEDFFKLCTYKN